MDGARRRDGRDDRWGNQDLGPDASSSFYPLTPLATLEVTCEYSPVLLHVENHRPLYSAGMVWAGEAGPQATYSPLPLKLMTSSC